MAHQLLTNFPHDSLLDGEPWLGQRQATFRFELFNGVTGEERGEVNPIHGASLTHDTTRTIKRKLSLDLGARDTATVNTITDRIRVFMVFPGGESYPLGVYMFTDPSRQLYTSGSLSSMALSDEMFLVDQQITTGIDGVGKPTGALIQQVLAGLPVQYTMEPSSFNSAEAWSAGSSRGQILEQLSVTGDYFSPWFDNQGVLRFIRSFDPATQLPDLDYDHHQVVIREPIILTDDLITAPNRFIVISNAAEDATSECVATYDVPPTAPHSIASRGFVIADVQDLQLSNITQAQAVVEGIGQRMTVFERVSLTTAPDPRHDSYNVIKWQGALWLELAWSMALVEGGTMSHLLRKSYAA